ncbi:type II toxin-antitoxin system RelE/ParE family toxin [Xenorhabdus sp. Reich]|uniref:Type II toxin-antitoxin system RelE/ParE family toxin n=1 Tax=Xenorhabdus littoralis TaxID=2582835 RepID=A0ABU4SMS0_9GAMM|nr:type II toxin-antitoxin system RelE/ParE family toxin [Xenorhabdus sp. Reich]MDX7999944.1 type II toxin-antitoxin system RelE/ParE family toxin [Xenorhabdus sp. Reich]
MFELEFHPEVLNEISQLNKIIKAKLLNAMDKLEARGHELRYPDTRPIQGQLFELRTSGKDISRTFFAFEKDRKIYILRTFIKKSAKTPTSEIELALKRLKELLDEN